MAWNWLVAVVLRPFGALLLFGFALALSRLLWPFIPAGMVRTLLYDRTLQKRHPKKTLFLFCLFFYGTVLLVARLVR